MGEQEHSAYIVIHGPGHDGSRLALREGITSFGRLPANDVILLGDLVSRHHARITYFEGRATLQDLGSHNGCWIEGSQVSSRVLKDKDEVRIGNFRIAFNVGPMPSGVDETTAGEEKKRQQHALTGGPVDVPAPAGSVLVEEIEKAQQGVGHQAHALHFLYRSSDALASAVDVFDYMQEMLGLGLENVAADQAVWLRRHGKTLRVELARDAENTIERPHMVMSVVRWAVTKKFSIRSEDVKNDMRFESDLQGPSQSVICVPILEENELVSGALYFSRQNSAFSQTELEAVAAVAHLAQSGLARVESRRIAATERALNLMHSPRAAQSLAQAASGLTEGQLQQETGLVAVCDVHGLAAIADRLKPGPLAEFLENYHQTAAQLAELSQGAVETLGGSRILMLFGQGQSKHYGEECLKAVIKLRTHVDQLLKEYPDLGQRRLRAGVSAGTVIYGVTGATRLTYNVLGDPVAAACALEHSSSAGRILIGEGALSVSRPEIWKTKKVGSQAARAQKKPVAVYELLSLA